MEQAENGIKVVVIGLVLNTVLAVTKILGGLLGNSYALIADGIESCVDIFSSLIVWGGLRVASKPADEDHPYGHGKAEPLAAMVVAVVLLGAAFGIAIQSIREIIHPALAPHPFTLFILAAVILLKEGLFRAVIRLGERAGSLSLQAEAWHQRSDAITSAAAFLGISLALTGGKGFASADDWAALFASCIIAYNGQRVLRYALHEVMDASPSADLEARVRATAREVEGVQEIDKCRMRKSGMCFFVDIHVVVDGHLTVTQGHEIARLVRKRLCAADLRIGDVLVHVEPIDEFRRQTFAE